MKYKIIAIDMGGVIKVDGGEMAISGSLDAIRKLKNLGYKIFIFTTDPDTSRNWIGRNAPDLKDLEITNIKKPASVYIDDLGFRFISWEETLKELNI